MKEIIEYTVIYGKSKDSLIDYVNSRIRAGWQPFSEITMKTYNNQPPDFYQPMVKYRPEPTNSI